MPSVPPTAAGLRPESADLPRRSVRIPLTLALALLTLLAACNGSGQKAGETTSAEAIRGEGKELFSPAWSTNAAPPPEAGSIREIGSLPEGMPWGNLNPTPKKPAPAQTGPVDPTASHWTIALGVFRGENHQAEANAALSRVRTEGGLPSAYLQRRGPATVVAFGQYSGPTDPRAADDLSRIQSMQVNGAPAFASAYLCPPYQSKGAEGQLREYDLRRAKQLYGDAALYTLQVGWYGREDLPRTDEATLKEARAAAEEAAARLRREGELAFFYHGPNRSMVTVGVFDSSDFDPVNRPGIESARLRDARRRHPLNLYNGAGYSYKSPGMREPKLLSSGLVLIPTR